MQQKQSQTSALVKDAAELFKAKQFQQAKELYIEAAKVLGERNFSINIALCDQKISGRSLPILSDTKANVVVEGGNSDQLAQTQALLEKYFNRCQELEYKLLDRN